MAVDPRSITGFLEALATFVAAQATLTYVPATGGDLYLHRLPEITTLASVIRVTSNPAVGYQPHHRLRVQIITRGGTAHDDEAAMNRAEAIFDTMLTDNRLELRGVTLDVNWRLVKVSPILPQSIGRDEKDRPLISMNMEVIAALLPE